MLDAIDPTGHLAAQFPELETLPSLQEPTPEQRAAEIERRGVWAALAM